MFSPSNHRTIVFISLFTVIIGVTVMAGWLLNVPVLTQVIPGFVEMVFNMAFCFVLFGIALLVTQFRSEKYQSRIFFALSIIGAGLGFVTLLEFLFHFNAGIDELFVRDTQKISTDHLYAGRMAYNSAICLTLLGAGFLLIMSKKRVPRLIGQYCFHGVSIIASIALIGYLYGVSLFHSLWYVSSMATHTAVLFLLLSIGASLLNPSIGITGLFTGKQIGHRLAQRLFVLIVIMLIGLGAVRIQTQHYDLFTFDTGIALLVVCFLLAFLGIIWGIARWLNKIDTMRTAAEAEVKRMNAELEKRVEERTLESKKNEEKYHSLIEQASDAIYVLGPGMNFIDVNASMCKMMGYSRDELLKMHVKDLIEPAELKRDPLLNVLDDPDKPVFRERTFMRKDGSTLPVEVNVKVFPGRMVMVMARDITERKKIEAERREAEKIILKEKMLSDTIINSLPGVFYLMTAEGKHVRWNANLEALTGYSGRELEHLAPYDLIAPEDYEKVEKTVERVFEEGYAAVEAAIIAKDGTKTSMLLTGTPILYEGERCLLGMGIDISLRVKAEEELRLSEQKYKVLFDSSPMPLWMIAKDDMTIIAVNDAAMRLYGYTQEELLNNSVTMLRPSDDQSRGLAGSLRMAGDGYVDAGIVRHLKKDGTPMFVNIIAHDIVFEGRNVRLSFTNDITKRLKAEESLQKSEANLQTILRTTNIVFVTLSKDLEILAFNPKAADFVKLHYNCILEKGHSFRDYLSPERAPTILNYLQKVLKGRTIEYEIDYRGHWYHVSFAPITGGTGEILGMLITLEEITERKVAEQDLKKAYGSIQNHINSIKGMAWKQSHLMRSPLANLKALANLLQMHPADKDALRHFQTELDRLDAIIHEMAQDASDHVL